MRRLGWRTALAGLAACCMVAVASGTGHASGARLSSAPWEGEPGTSHVPEDPGLGEPILEHGPDGTYLVNADGSWVRVQSSEESLEQDLRDYAKVKGWTVEQARHRHAESEAVGEVAVRIAGVRPDVFVGSALGPTPDEGNPMIYIKGPADDEIRALAAHPTTPIDIIDNQPYSAAELDERLALLMNTLDQVGYDNFASAYDIRQRGRLMVNIQMRPGLPDDPEIVRSLLPREISQDIEIWLSLEPASHPDSAYAGLWMGHLNSPNPDYTRCTSGYSTFGRSPRAPHISTAGHCRLLDQFKRFPRAG